MSPCKVALLSFALILMLRAQNITCLLKKIYKSKNYSDVVTPTKPFSYFIGGQPCDETIKLGGKFYAVENLFRIDGFPSDISIDWKTGNIFFVNYSKFALKRNTFILRRNASSYTAIRELKNIGQSIAVDQRNGIVYFATDNGIYVFDDYTTSAVPFGAVGTDVTYLDVGDNGTRLYYATWGAPGVRVISADGRRPAQQPGRLAGILGGERLTIDRDNNIFYETPLDRVPRMLRPGSRAPLEIKLENNERLNDYFVDRANNVFAIAENGDLFKIDKRRASAVFVGNVDTFNNVSTVGVEADDNFIIGFEDGMVRLRYIEKNPCSMLLEDL